MREELTEAVIRRCSAERRSQKSHKTNRETPAPEPPYEQSNRPKACNSVKNGDPTTDTPPPPSSEPREIPQKTPP